MKSHAPSKLGDFNPLKVPICEPPRKTSRWSWPGAAQRGWVGLSLLLALMLLGLLGACSADKGWVRVQEPDLDAWRDDGDKAALVEAVQGSIAYYEKINPSTSFRFANSSYSAREMAASLRHFLNVLHQARDADELSRRIAQEFIIYESVRIKAENLFTGYYEPELPAAMEPTGNLNTPLYALPSDLIKVRLSNFGDDMPGKTLVGRLRGNDLLPYPTRAEIETRSALREKARILAYVDKVDLYFLQVQGSGVLRFQDGRLMQVGYAASNGHPYRSLGRFMIRNKMLTKEEVTLQTIRGWLEANPGKVQSILRQNPSYVFFQEIKGGPYGNIQVGLTPRRSLAMDHRLFPKGALAFVETMLPQPTAAEGATHDQGSAMASAEKTQQGESSAAQMSADSSSTEPVPLKPFRRFMLVQDTGGAIIGHGRGDIFFGAGERAEWVAGHLKAPGRVFLLVSRREYIEQAQQKAN